MKQLTVRDRYAIQEQLNDALRLLRNRARYSTDVTDEVMLLIQDSQAKLGTISEREHPDGYFCVDCNDWHVS